ncbi:MAG TPA: diaminopimelate decarboxylase [Ktedonobacteraceae bacterium]|nr:diaminopimelate decarboxylase [Ktedonobacteraceae bacterium]
MPQIHPSAHLLPDTASFSPEGVFCIAGHSVPELALRYGTPLYMFDRVTIVNACKQYQRAFREHYTASPVQFIYAAKAYLSPMIARIIAEQGMGLDVVSGGELRIAQQGGFPVERILFHGNNKSAEELELALQLGVGRIALDNWSELETLTKLARASGRQPAVLVRVAPGVQTETHRYLQTGHAAAKFGFPLGNGEAKAALVRILAEGQLHLLGLHAHTGTMLRETRPYEESVERLFELTYEVYEETLWWPQEISPGGGWAIDTPGDTGDIATPGVDALARALQASMNRQLHATGRGLPAPTLILEPGRSIIARAGVAVYRIGARKQTPGGITYLFVDGGMGDNIRPALYGARYTALALERAFAPLEESVCVAGRYCESGDILIEQVMLPLMHDGELLALPTAGAYCLPMTSNYNLVPRPAVILVDENHTQLMERRETVEDMLKRYQFFDECSG